MAAKSSGLKRTLVYRGSTAPFFCPPLDFCQPVQKKNTHPESPTSLCLMDRYPAGFTVNDIINPGLQSSSSTQPVQQLETPPPPPLGQQQQRYVPPQRYVGVGVVNVYSGSMEVDGRAVPVPMVARVSLIDYRGQILLDTYVRPTYPVSDYRSSETNITYTTLSNASLFVDIQRQVATLIQGKILVGHRIWNFLSVLGIRHSALDTRDLALFRPMRKRLKSDFVLELAVLVEVFMGRALGFQGEDSLEFSRAAMDLFRSCEGVFESAIAGGAWPCDLPPESYANHYT
ncbi:hypothetical protein D9619_003369 [Psilocybe cf. subviscida]|uniref:Exonuclease domain-containing protein n=1 Tax=Psilocybe cf. subviscida TaxID=2480587 RepID=A0A8H5ETM8_9AGAR|nr:hypothetical protein D9619_003369 [Psilocybe cf. subviscida]